MQALKVFLVVCAACMLSICTTTQAWGPTYGNGTIGDYVWLDADRDGIQDAGEKGINGVRLVLYDEVNKNAYYTLTKTGGPSNKAGYYVFEDVAAGSYTVFVDKATVVDLEATIVGVPGSTAGNDSDDPMGTPVTMPTDDSTNTTIDFGYVDPTCESPCDGTIGDYVWFDTNRNGIQDDGETGINGVRLILYDKESHETRYTVTITGGPLNQPGYYAFEKVCAGSYVVSVDTGTVVNLEPTVEGAPGSTAEDDSDDPSGTLVVLQTDNSSDMTIDFGYVKGGDVCPCKGVIGDYVWLDADMDGIQDPAETGINGIMVVLYDEEAGEYQSVTTFTGGPLNQPGYYLFEELCAGTYVVSINPETVPPGYAPTLIYAPGSTSENDSDDHDGTTVVLETDNSSDKTIDFGYVTVCTGRIGDYVWIDSDGDGIQDADEQGINGVEVLLLDDTGVRSVVTITGGPLNQPGYYLFDGLCAGTYVVSVNPETVPDGYVCTVVQAPGSTIENDSDNCQGTTVTLPSDDSSNLTIDFGYVVPSTCTGKIGDYVWLDANQNGIQDSDESGINGIDVQLYDEAGLLATVTTFKGGPLDQDGYYLFNGLCAGTYAVLIDENTVPPGYLPTEIHAAGSTASNDSDDHDGTVVVLTADDSTDLTIDFGYVLECADCDGGVTQLTLRYNGASAASVAVYEGSKKEQKKLLYQGTVSPSSEFTFTGVRSDLKMGSEISVWVDDSLHAKIHTSCSQPIGSGLIRGDFEVVDGYSKDGGRLCPLPDCLECEGGVTQLTLRYLGLTSASVSVYEGSKQESDKLLYAGQVNPGGDFTFNGVRSDLKMGSEIGVWVNGSLHVKIHTSCSQPIGPGLVRGDFKVIEGYSKDGGKLCPLPPQPDCGECDGGVTRLTLRYLGAASATVFVYEGKDAESDKVLFGATVSPDETFTFTGIRSDLKMGSEISIWVNGSLQTKIHTSCSQPIGPGMIRGDFEIVEGYSKDGGKLCSLPDCGECKGGVIKLTLQYLGSNSANIIVYEGKDAKADKVLFSGQVAPNGTFTFTGVRSDGTMSSEISLWVGGSLQTKIHTSCSQPIGPGLVQGNFKVVEGYSKDGGKLCEL